MRYAIVVEYSEIGKKQVDSDSFIAGSASIRDNIINDILYQQTYEYNIVSLNWCKIYANDEYGKRHFVVKEA